MLAVLTTSLVVNAVLLAWVGRRLRRRGLRAVFDGLRRRPGPRPDFAALARRRFVEPSAGAVILLGDSQLDVAPVTDLFAFPVRNRAISGARTVDVLSWIDQVLAERPARIVLEIGSNDVYFARPATESETALRELFGRITADGCALTVLSVPPLPGHERAVAQLNGVLAGLAGEFGAGFVDLAAALTGLAWTDDGLHLNPAAYRAIGPLVRAAVAAFPGTEGD